MQRLLALDEVRPADLWRELPPVRGRILVGRARTSAAPVEGTAGRRARRGVDATSRCGPLPADGQQTWLPERVLRPGPDDADRDRERDPGAAGAHGDCRAVCVQPLPEAAGDGGEDDPRRLSGGSLDAAG